MNDEIKKILDMLKDDIYIPSDDNRTYKLLDRDDTRHLLDYITNLQQEKEDYKSRVEKTTEKLSFIDEALENDTLNVPLCIAKINSALNILQNGSDKSE